jgi:acylphosphatase
MTTPADPSGVGDEVVVRYRVVVSGRVQGVWYRDSCRREARALGLAGWVRNRRDGTVEAAVEGPASAVDRLVAWMGQGSPRAVVTDVDLAEEPPTGETGFHVR